MSEQTDPKSAFAPATGYATGKRNTTIADLRALVRSQNHYVQHWRSRAERAEADCAALREEREELIRIKNAAYRDYCCNGDLADGPICSLYGLWSVFGKSHNHSVIRRVSDNHAGNEKTDRRGGASVSENTYRAEKLAPDREAWAVMCPPDSPCGILCVTSVKQHAVRIATEPNRLRAAAENHANAQQRNP